MVRINGNFESNRNYFVKNEKEIQKEIVKEINVDEGKQAKSVEKGEDLLKSARVANDAFMFVNQGKLDGQIANDLKELYQMAGIGHRALPTAHEYARIAGATRADLAKFTDFETEKDIQNLFGNAQLMAVLEEESRI